MKKRISAFLVTAFLLVGYCGFRIADFPDCGLRIDRIRVFGSAIGNGS